MHAALVGRLEAEDYTLQRLIGIPESSSKPLGANHRLVPSRYVATSLPSDMSPKDKWPAPSRGRLIFIFSSPNQRLRQIRLACRAIAHRDLPIQTSWEESPLSRVCLHPEG